jgi:signal transduction histidine kinase/CheY-like chemotaxis protein
MITAARKLKIRKIPILRYCLIIVLLSILFVGSEYLYLHYKKAQMLRGNIENVIDSRENVALIDTCIYRLYSADNNSRLYTVTGKKHYFDQYNDDIKIVLSSVDKIRFNKNDVPDPEKFKQLVHQKADKTTAYMKQRRVTDSLLKSTAKVTQSLKNLQTVKPKITAQRITTFDTVKAQVVEKPKKKFLGRVFAALSKKKEEPAKPFIITKDTVIYSKEISKGTLQSGKTAYDYYQKLNAANQKLIKGEKQILLLNNELADEIISSLKSYKAIEQAYIENSRRQLKEQMGDVFFNFSQGAAINFIFLILVFIIVFYNMWKIFRNEQEIIDYSNDAEEYAQLKSKFLAGMSHEIRTPLNSVIGFSEQLSQEDLPASQKEQVAAIRNSSVMILDLVNEILDFSKYETGKMNLDNAPFMVHQAFEEVISTMNIHALKKDITLESDIQIAENLCCEGDKMRLKQVLMNLVGNAIKFTRKGGVTIKAQIEQRLPGDALLTVSVVDTGIGIEKHALPHVFDEFSQVAEAQKATRHKGTGLGLAICKKIIELQGGTIKVKSTPGVGSMFTFKLTLKQLSENACVAELGVNDGVIAEVVKDQYILLADDNKLNVLLAKTILKKWSIRCDVAYDGQEALDLFKTNNYDMVLTDIQMPVMDGLELTSHIRQFADPVKSKVIIMALTANVMKEDRDIYFGAGVNDVILKPFLEKDLIEKIAVAIQNNSTAMRFIA